VALASPLSKKVELVRRLEEAGAAAVVLYSLFEEQITHESRALDHYLTHGGGELCRSAEQGCNPLEHFLRTRSFEQNVEVIQLWCFRQACDGAASG